MTCTDSHVYVCGENVEAGGREEHVKKMSGFSVFCSFSPFSFEGKEERLCCATQGLVDLVHSAGLFGGDTPLSE